MTLIHVNRFAKAFPQEAKTEGYPLFARGDVRLLGDNDVRVQFRVAGEFDCHFEIRGKMLKLGCTCVEAQQGTLCRHLWSGFSFLEETRCLFSQNLRFATDVELDQAHFRLPVADAREVAVATAPPIAESVEARSAKARRLAYILTVDSLSRMHEAFIERVVQQNNGKGAWRVDANADATLELHEIGTDLDRELAAVFAAVDASFDADMPLFVEAQAAHIQAASPEFAEHIAKVAASERFFLDLRGRTLRLSMGSHVTPTVALEAAGDRFKCSLDLDAVEGEIAAILDNGLLMAGNAWHRFSPRNSALGELLRAANARVELPAREVVRMLCRLHPDDFREYVNIELTEVVPEPPQPILELGPHRLWQPKHRLGASIRIAYGAAEMAIAASPLVHVDLAAGTWFARSHEIEENLLRSFLSRKGIGREGVFNDTYVQNKGVDRLLIDLEAEGWRIRWSGRPVAGNCVVEINVTMLGEEIDVVGDVVYGDARIPVVDVLEQWRKNRSFLDLGNGRLGAFPSGWLSANEGLMSVASTKTGALSFAKAYAGAVHALVESADAATCDGKFSDLRDRLLRTRQGKLKLPRTFKAVLRSYQTEGVSWLLYLRSLGFGGLLADDMGLGKTVQTLGYLESRRGQGMSLAVVPRSLLGNWRREAARFAPEMRVYIHHGAARHRALEGLSGFDLVLTTYGTLRNDIEMFETIVLDTCILDEAQAIKNRWSKSSATIHRIRAEHRIALTGTPIQNHVREIANIFDFLNPGILAHSRSLKTVLNSKQDPTPGEIDLFAKAIAPFMLRRIKEDVEADLPPKTVQDITCELDGNHLAAYNGLLNEVRTGISARVRADGWGRSKMHVFEAMTRLRMCACHPSLGAERDGDSTKIELLIEMLAEVVESGRKALVFSQFTSLLAIVKDRLGEEDITFEYLDGQTRDRDNRVEHFQTDPLCPVFLISLQAGGVGLNLTAAEYVFILDPWWNPAAEQQAIDRTHRIGQDKPVFVYRIIAANTIEERVLQLQAEKTLLVQDVLGNAASVARDIDESDLDLLLS